MNLARMMNLVNLTTPYAWDDSLSVFEMIGKLVAKINELIGVLDEELEAEVSKQVAEELKDFTTEKLAELLKTGELAQMILNHVELVVGTRFKNVDQALADMNAAKLSLQVDMAEDFAVLEGSLNTRFNELETSVNDTVAGFDAGVTLASSNTYTHMTPHAEFPDGITYSNVRLGDVPGGEFIPERRSGTLITHKVNKLERIAYDFQEYIAYNGYHKFRRRYDGNGGWTEWEKMQRITEQPMISNTAGAVTAVINTGLDWVKNTNLMTYDQHNTLYNDPTTPVSGKYGMDCSSFIQACLEGVTLDNSKYRTGENHAQWWAFKFPVEAKVGSDKRVYANAMGRWAYDNGWGYLPSANYDNVMPGDLLFCSNSSSDWDWRKIGHVMMCIARNLDGSLTVIECTSGSQVISTSRVGPARLLAKKVYYCARLPLTDVPLAGRNINYEARKIRSTTPETNGWVLGYINPDNEFQEYKMYTAIFRVKYTGAVDAYPALRMSVSDISKNVYTFSGMPEPHDNMYKCSFYIPFTIPAGYEKKIVICRAGNHSTALIDLVALYEGVWTGGGEYPDHREIPVGY